MCFKLNTKRYACNYNCEICKKSGKTPNILGKFIVIDNNNILCTGCRIVFIKTTI
jgi:hypothetical protein